MEGSPHEAPPAAFGPFRVLHQVGAGGLGPVFRAHDPAEGRLVAVKLFRFDLLPEQATAFAGALQDLVDRRAAVPGLAAPVAAGIEGHSPWLAQEYAAGEALDAVLRQSGPPPLDRARAVIRRTAQALDAAADIGLLHGLLHPRDLIIDGTVVRIVDAGVAQALEQAGVRLPVRHPYSAPEQAAGERWGRPADVFAFSAVAYEMLTGRRIGVPGAQASLADRFEGGTVVGLDAAFARGLAVDPAGRFETAWQLAEAVDLALAEAALRPRARTRLASPMLPLDDPAPAPAVEPPAQPPTPSSDEDLDLALQPEAAATIADVDLTPPVVVEHVDQDDVPAIETSDRDEDAKLAAPATAPDTEWWAPVEDENDDGDPAEADEADEDARVPVIDDSAFDDLDAPPPPQPTRPVFAAAEEAPDRSRALLPLAATLVIGLGVGFAAGYWTAYRPADPEVALTDVEPAPAGEAAPGQPYTETDVSEPELAPSESLEPPPSPQDTPGPARPAPATPAPPREPAPRPAAPRPSPAQAPPADRAAPVVGRILVRTSPPGARVSVNGQDRGTTPLALRDVPLGDHTVRVTHEGYAAVERRLTLTPADPVGSLDLRLAPAAPPRPAPRAP